MVTRLSLRVIFITFALLAIGCAGSVEESEDIHGMDPRGGNRFVDAGAGAVLDSGPVLDGGPQRSDSSAADGASIRDGGARMPPPCDWDVLNGPIPVGASLASGDGVTDDTAALQSIIDTAASHETICMPAPTAHYRTTQGLDVNKPLTLLGAGWSGGTPGREARSGGTFVGAEINLDNENTYLLHVLSNGVRIDGLKLTSAGVIGPWAAGHQSNDAIWAAAQADLSVKNCWFENWSGRAIALFDISDVAILNNHITRCHYAGVYLGRNPERESARVHIIGNRIYHLSEPTTGAEYGNAYGIVTTGLAPVSDVVIMDNHVERVRVWCGICLHGSAQTLIVANEVTDCKTLVFKTWSGNGAYPFAGNDNRWIDNVLSGSISDQFWNAGPRSLGNTSASYELRNHWIGNRWSDSGWAISRGQQDLRMHHNRFVSSFSLADGHLGFHYSNNTPASYGHQDGDLTTRDGFAAPPTPGNVASIPRAEDAVLSWSYATGSDHDSFEIQFSADGVSWTTVAWRPAADGLFVFGSVNPDIIPFDPLQYVDHQRDGGSYRVRAWNGDAASAWSTTARSR